MRAMEYTPVIAPLPPGPEPSPGASREILEHYSLTLVRTFNPHWRALEEARAKSPWQPMSDAECAAHYWQTIRDADVQGYSGRRARPKGQCVIREAFTWYRFATHPHASEVEQ